MVTIHRMRLIALLLTPMLLAGESANTVSRSGRSPFSHRAVSRSQFE